MQPNILFISLVIKIMRGMWHEKGMKKVFWVVLNSRVYLTFTVFFKDKMETEQQNWSGNAATNGDRRSIESFKLQYLIVLIIMI